MVDQDKTLRLLFFPSQRDGDLVMLWKRRKEKTLLFQYIQKAWGNKLALCFYILSQLQRFQDMEC
jgi:hypothetical protein